MKFFQKSKVCRPWDNPGQVAGDFPKRSHIVIIQGFIGGPAEEWKLVAYYDESGEGCSLSIHGPRV